MSDSARRRIAAAVRLAADSRASSAERDAARAGARRIADANGLPDPFSSSTSAEGPPRSRFRDDLFERPRSPFFAHGDLTREDLDDVLSAFARHRRKAAGDAFSRAWTRAAEEGCGEPQPRSAVDWLWGEGVRVYGAPPAEDGSRRWTIPEESDLEYSDEGVREVATRRGWRNEDATPTMRKRLDERHERVLSFLHGKRFKVMPNGRFWTTVDPVGRFYFDKHDRASLYRLARELGFQG